MGKLIEKISDPDHILAAYYSIREKFFHPELELFQKYVPGIDGLDLKGFEKHLDDNIEACRDVLIGEEDFHPQLMREVPKDLPGEVREVYLQSLRDKVAQKAIALSLADRLEKYYFPNLYSYRRKRHFSNKEAARKIRARLVKTNGLAFVFRTDIPDYTDHLDQKRLMGLFESIIPDEREVLLLLERFFKQKCYSAGEIDSRTIGVPSGSPLTPLCANIYLSEIDGEMFRRGIEYYRYGDDILIIADSEEDLSVAKKRLAEALHACGLNLSPSKTETFSPGQGFDYLGYRFENGKVSVAKKSLDKYRRWIRKELPRNRYHSHPNKTREEQRTLLKRIIIDLNVTTEQNLRQLPWIRSFPVLDSDDDLRKLDSFIKDRMRLCIVGKPTPRLRQIIPDVWFGELGYKSIVGAFYRISRRRGLGPYSGWRRFYGSNFEEHAGERSRLSSIGRKWNAIKFYLRYIKSSLGSHTFGDRKRISPSDNDVPPDSPSDRSS